MPSPITTGNEKLVGADKLADNYYKQRMQESEDFLRQMETANQQAYQNAKASYMGMNNAPIRDTSQVYRYDENDPMASWGSSQYDTQELTNLTAGQLNDTRYENQSSIDVLANGLGKMLGTAGSTFVSSLIGLPYGAVQAVAQGRASALWDNDVTQALGEFDDWMDNSMVNYQSEEQKQKKWYQRMTDLNWWADDVIKNAGFTLGAAASMAVGSGALGLMSKAMGAVNNVSKGAKITNNVLSALFSATGEGMIEARNGVEERNKLENQKLDDALAPEYAALDEQENLATQEYNLTGDYDTYSARMRDIISQRQLLDQRKEAGQQQIQESGLEMGNKILLGNQVLLTAGNLIQFSKLMTNSFNNARHAAETAAKDAKPFLVGAKRVGEDLAAGYRIFGKNLGKANAALKGLITEGSEEMNQQWIQSGSGAAYEEKDVNDYWRAKLDPESYRDTTAGLYTLGNAISRGFNESWGDFDQWEQFVIGGMTGMAGSAAPTKLFNQDKTKSVIDPRRYFSWEGGAYNEIQDFNKQYDQYEENINDLNKLLADGNFETRLLDMSGHTYQEGQKEEAAAADDKKAWKDADDKQNILDIQSFLRAGKLDDLRAIYQSMGEDLTDKDVQGIVERTTKLISQEQDKQDHFAKWDARIAAAKTPEEKAELEAAKAADSNYEGKSHYEGAFVDEDGNQKVSNDVVRKEVKKNSEELQRKLDSYLESIDVVNQMTGGQLTKDQEDNLAYLHNMSKENTHRFDSIMQKVRKVLPSKFLIKTEKSPEQLAKQFSSSDLAFTRDENTKKGYVEVDTSMMNDKTFGIFFADNVIGGSNIEEKDEKKAAKDREEQLRTNEQLIKDSFVKNAMTNEGKTLIEAVNSQEMKDLIRDINDATELRNSASEFYNAYLEYMTNPTKVDKAKQKEEKKAVEEKKQKDTEKKSVDEMLGMSDDDLISILSDSKKGKNKAGGKAKKALAMKNGRSKAKKELDAAVKAGAISDETASDALKLLDEQISRMSQEEEVDAMSAMDALASRIMDTDTEAMSDYEALLSPQEIESGEYDEAAYEARLSKAKDAISKISDSVEDQLVKLEDLIDKGKINKVLDDDDSPSKEAEEAVARSADESKERNMASAVSRSKNKDEDPAALKPVQVILPTVEEAREEAVNPIEDGKAEQALIEDKEEGQAGGNIPQEEKRSNWHPWMSSTSEVGNTTNAPYEPSKNDPDAEFKKTRYDVIRKKLVDSRAYERRRQGLITPGMKIGFKVFKDVNDVSGDFVIFFTDEGGNILGDLPSNDPRLATTRRDIPMDDLYDEIRQRWEEASEDERNDENGMSFDLYTEVDHVLVGKVLYQDERQTVMSLTEGKTEPLFAIKGNNGIMLTGEKDNGQQRVTGIHLPKTGNTGQPYVLIQTPNYHNGLNPRFRYYTVPVSTYTIAELNPDTMAYKVLRELLVRIQYADRVPAKAKVDDNTAKKLLQSLIAVGNVHVNLDEGSNSKKGLGIRVTTYNRALGSERGMPYTIYEGKREDMDIDAIMQALGRFHINVSAEFINGADSRQLRKYLTIDGKPLTDKQYNQMIAEVAHTNAASPETVNDWFTVRPLQKRGGAFVMAPKDEDMPTWNEVSSYEKQYITLEQDGKKKDWEVRPSEGYKVYDENGVEIFLFDKDKNHTKEEQAEAARIAAEVFGRFTLKNREEPYAVVLEGKTRIYDPRNRKFMTPKTLDKEGYDYGALKAIKENRTLSETEKYQAIQEMLGRRPTVYAFDEEEEPKKGTEQPKKVDHTEEVNKILDSMRQESSHYHLVKWDETEQKYVEDPEGEYYMDDRNGNIHARVSNITEADEDIINANNAAGFGKNNPQLKIASTGAGNIVDRFTRRFFENGDLFEGLDLSNKTDRSVASERLNTFLSRYPFPNISNEKAMLLAERLHEFKKSFGEDWEIDSSGIVASGIVSFDGKTSVNVAGTIDLLAYNPKTGQFAIVDMKSALVPLFNKNGKLKTDSKTKAKLEHWIAQQTLYGNFINSKFFDKSSLKINGLRILPFNVSYSTNFNETNYTYEDGVLRDKGIEVDINPSLMITTSKEMIKLTPKTAVKYKIAQLPDSVKRLMSSNPVSKPVRIEIEKVKSQLIDMRDSVPEGRTLKDFISPSYAGDVIVQKLIGILERNKGETKPVMMTKASQDLLMRAIDKAALDKAVQEAEALKQGISIDIPGKVEESTNDILNYLESEFDPDDFDVVKQLPEELLRIVKDNIDEIKDMLIDGKELTDIENYLRSSKATRHRKATEGDYQILDLPKEMRWLNRNLPQLSRERKVQIIKGLIACSDGSMDFGRVENGIMMIGNQSAEGTVYHEAFHYVVQFLMTDDEIDNLFRAAQERYGNLPSVALEERLAEDFSDYVLGIDPEESKLKKFFRELWEAIKAMFNNNSYIQTLFRDINNGVYSGREFKNDRENQFSNIAKEDREVSRDYEYLTDDERERIDSAGISVEQYNNLSKEDKEYLLHCVI